MVGYSNGSAVLSAFDEQIRRHPQPDSPDGYVEYDEGVTRGMSAGDGWNGVSWSDLDTANAEAVIAAQIERFAELSRPWECKHYSYTPPQGVELQAVVDEQGVDALVSIHDEVFGGDHTALGRALLAGLAGRPSTTAAVVAVAEGRAIAAGRVEFAQGTDFASLWGGAKLPAWRGRGVFRMLVARRAALAAARGFRYLQVDATPDSRPILAHLDFVELATTTRITHTGRS